MTIRKRRFTGLVLFLALLSAGIIASRKGCASEPLAEEDLPFTRQFAVPEEDYLFINGVRVRGEVFCEYEPGKALTMAGLQVLPVPDPDRFILPLSEERIRELVGAVPYVTQRVERGMSWREACLEYDFFLQDAVKAFRNSYHEVWQGTKSVEAARRAAEETLRAVGTEIVDPEREVKWDGGLAMIYWRGKKDPDNLGEEKMQRAPAFVPPPSLTQHKALFLVTSIRGIIAERGPSVVVISGGGLSSVSGQNESAAEGVREVLEQIRLSTTDSVVGGKLTSLTVQEILEHGGVDQ